MECCAHFAKHWPKRGYDNQNVLVFADSYTTLAGAINVNKVTRMYAASGFVSHWVIQFGTPTHQLTENGPSSSLSFSQPSVVNFKSDIWRQLHIFLRPMVRRKCYTRRSSRVYTITRSNIRQTEISLFIHWRMSRMHKCMFNGNDTIQSRDLSSPAGSCVSDAPLSIPTRKWTPPEPQSFRERFSRKLAKLRAHSHRTLKHAQVRYKHYCDQSASLITKFLQDQYVFIDFLPE